MEKLQRILIVEDDPDSGYIASFSLRAIGGFDVEWAMNGHEGLEKASHWHPDLVLLDAMMPDLDGPTVLRRLREDRNTADLPVVFLTANTQPNDIVRYRDAGAIAVFAKPFDPLRLAAQLQDLWSGLAPQQPALK